ncbi:MAG: hypothetical protein QM627_09480 [Luteolibacter sp.]
MTAPLSAPEKELRFTRSGQAVGFWLAGAVLATAGLTLLATALYREENPFLPHPLWAVVPLFFSGLVAQWAVRLTRHAYVILTPLGMEIFSFFRPARGMQMISWQEIRGAEVNAGETRLTLHFNEEKTSGIHLSLKPIRKDRRSLLAKAVLGRVSPRSS